MAESISASLDFTRDATIMDVKTRENAMGCYARKLLVPLLLVGFMSAASAGDRKPEGSASGPSRPVLTGKERLGPKWTDEQRIDNCKVPIDKRGTKPRPSACSGAPSS